MESTATEPLRYILLGGFLGAGKTTAALALARRLTNQGRRVGLITNDQSHGLVDTERMRAAGYVVEEITGGCFCCRFDALVDSTTALLDQGAPEVLIAEPVGSCTDLQATVTYPLRQLYGEQFTIAPLSVVVDPHRCAAVLGVWGDRAFSDKVEYVYLKQLEEADIVVVHKSDMLSKAQCDRLVAAIRSRFPDAAVHVASSISGEGVDPWYEAMLTGELGRAATMDIDYDIYAEGEARLGWVNSSGEVTDLRPFDGNELLLSLCGRLAQRLDRVGAPIAHLKATLAPSDREDLGAVSITATGAAPSFTSRLAAPVERGELVVNLRAEGDPEVLERELCDEIDALPQTFELRERAAFRPARPVPTHRMASAEAE